MSDFGGRWSRSDVGSVVQKEAIASNSWYVTDAILSMAA